MESVIPQVEKMIMKILVGLSTELSKLLLQKNLNTLVIMAGMRVSLILNMQLMKVIIFGKYITAMMKEQLCQKIFLMEVEKRG